MSNGTSDQTAWIIASIPDHWSPIGSLGLRGPEVEGFVENLILASEQLPPGTSLADYVETQLTGLRSMVEHYEFVLLGTGRVLACDEAMTIRVTCTFRGRNIVHYQHYLRSENWVGAVTWSRPPPPPASDARTFWSLLGHLRFEPGGA